jgi:hypothetical protein
MAVVTDLARFRLDRARKHSTGHGIANRFEFAHSFSPLRRILRLHGTPC